MSKHQFRITLPLIMLTAIIVVLSSGCATSLNMDFSLADTPNREVVHKSVLSNRENMHLLISSNAGWRAHIKAARKLEDVYHYISDHSVDELKKLRGDVSYLVKDARKHVSMAESYNLPNLSLYGHCRKKYSSPDDAVESRIPLENGIAIVSGVNELHPWIKGDGCVRLHGHIYRIESSRGRVIYGVIRGKYYDEFSVIANRIDLGTTALIAMVKR